MYLTRTAFVSRTVFVDDEHCSEDDDGEISCKP